jgi:hypothetical protein
MPILLAKFVNLIDGGKETLRALLDLGYRQTPFITQKSTVDGGYVIHKPDHGIIIILEEEPRRGCIYDEFDGSILDNIRHVIHCTARISVKSAQSCRRLANNYNFIFALTDFEKFRNLVKSGREDVDWLIYNIYVDARKNDWSLGKTLYPAALYFTKWENVIGDQILTPCPRLKEYLETQEEFYGCDREAMNRIDAAAGEPQGLGGDQQFEATVERLLSYLFR